MTCWRHRAAWLAIALAAAVLGPLSAARAEGELDLSGISGIPGASEMTPGAPSAPASPPAAPAAPQGRTAAGGLALIEEAWFAPASDLSERVDRTRRVSLELGVWNLDAAARAVMSGADGADGAEQAAAAARLAPDLPAGQMNLARSLWLDDEAVSAALRTALGSVAAIPRHVQASLWFGGTLLFLLGMGLVVGGLWCIAVFAGLSLSHAAHDLSDRLSTRTPGFARTALIGALLLAPLAFGEGLLGVAAIVFGIAVVYGSGRQRVVLLLAVAGVVAGAFPIVRIAGNTLTELSVDPVVEAAFSTAQGFAHPMDQVRLEAAADKDPLAAQALALQARRAGNLGRADALYQALVRGPAPDPAVVNNAANVRLNLGHIDSALELYRQSSELKSDPVVLFNLSQAHGRAFQVEDLSRILAEAQQLDGDLVAELTALQGAEPIGFVVDLPLDSGQIWRRILRSDAGERMAYEIRTALAPGRLGRDALVALGASGAVAVFFAGVGARVGRSRWCERCGRRVCQRCDPEQREGAVCNGCIVLFQQGDSADRELRLARINELRFRDKRMERLQVLASIFVPGAAGALAGRPLRALLGSLLAAWAVLAVTWRNGVVPDPLVAGATAPFVFLSVAAVAGLLYAAIVLVCIATRRYS